MPNADYKLNSPGHDINKYLFPFSFSQFPSPNSVHWNLEFNNYNIKNVRKKIKSVVVTNSSQLWEILDYLKAYLELMEGYVIKQLEYNLGSKRYGNRSSLSGKKKKTKTMSNNTACISEIKWKSFICVWLFETPWIVACLAPVSVRFSRPEYWSELPCLPPGDLPNLGIKPRSPSLQADSLP